MYSKHGLLTYYAKSLLLLYIDIYHLSSVKQCSKHFDMHVTLENPSHYCSLLTY